MKRAVLAVLALVSGGLAQAQGTPPVGIVAAENVYGDIAAQLAGPFAQVTSVLTRPDQDPHLFEATPSVARAIARARIVVLNGAEYDPWMAKLLAAAPGSARQAIVVATLAGRKTGDNPHLWYDPAVMPLVAQAISAALVAADPAHRAEYGQRLATLLAALEPVAAKAATLRARYAGTPVTATEPVFGLMASALGLAMRNERFQLAVMNDTEPSAADTAAFETDLRQRRVKLFIYNSQATNGAAQRLLRLARAAHIPVLPVTETEPPGTTYQAWMLGQLDALDAALASP